MWDGIPLHPVLVHVPLALAGVAPLVALILVAAIKGRLLHHRVWWLAVFLHLLLSVSAFLAVRTGEMEEERVEEIVGDDPIHTHEERAEAFRNATLGVLVLAGIAGVFFGNRRWGLRLAALSVAAGAAVGWMALGVGHSGGELTYLHGAASYYVEGGGPPVMRAAPGDTTDADHEDH